MSNFNDFGNFNGSNRVKMGQDDPANAPLTRLKNALGFPEIGRRPLRRPPHASTSNVLRSGQWGPPNVHGRQEYNMLHLGGSSMSTAAISVITALVAVILIPGIDP